MPTDEKPKAGHNLMRWGWAISIGYLLLLASYAYASRQSFLELSPNEVGDFLAGASSPLAFFWLVLGFAQQGHELRNSAEALRLQGEELKNSVAQQRELVRVTTEQLEHERGVRLQMEREAARAALPTLVLQERSREMQGNRCLLRLRITNIGTTCTQLRLTLPHREFDEVRSLQTDSYHDFSFYVDGVPDREIVVGARYVDRRGKPQETHFRLVPYEDEGGWSFSILDDSQSVEAAEG